MAYSATVSRESSLDGVIEITVLETEAGTATESDAIAVPERFRLLSIRCDKISGSGATFAPALYDVPGSGAAAREVYDVGTAGANINTTYGKGLQIKAYAGVVYHRAVAASGSDNTVVTSYRILPGWQ